MSQDKPLKKVTTSSLEALKLYSKGIDRHLMMDFESARNYYEEALKIDTGFTSAKASLGNILIEKFDPEKGRKLLSQAVRSVNNLTEREKLGILSFYAVNVEKNLPKGIEYAKMRINLYPDDVSARNNLGWYYMSSGQFENALKEYKATVRIFPDMALPYGGIIWIYLEKLGILDSAMVWANKMISDNPLNPWGYFYLGSAFLGRDSLLQAEKDFRRAMQMDPSFLMNNYRLAHSLRLEGKYSEAVDLLKKIRKENPDETSALYDLGINYQALGKQKEALENYKAFEKTATVEWVNLYREDPATYFAIGAISARLGNMETSQKMLEKTMGMDSSRHEKFAELLCLQGRIDEAIRETEKAIKKGYRDIVWLKINPDYQTLQGDQRYIELLSKNFR
jgi:tetratricopeptide (TPR) repeat protein